jgi:glycosyltransferase involved in cell wall biosynthesis
VPVNISVVSAALPPQLDGIADYTALLCAELAKTACVRVLTSRGPVHDPLPGVVIEEIFSPAAPKSVCRLADSVQANPPDWLLLQYNPFAYGKWGLNPYLPQTIRALKRRLPQMRFALMAHETFVPRIRWQFTVMRLWQCRQLKSLGRSADVLFFSTESWIGELKSWFPGKPLVHLPVGSNMPRIAIAPQEARQRLGIGPEKRVLGIFGTAHPSRMLGLIRQASEAAQQAGHDIVILYMGPDGGIIEETFKGLPVIADGPLPADEISRRLAAVDIYLSPFVDGVSTRRGSFITGLQHGLPTLGTLGPWTDSLLKAQADQAFLLADVATPEQFSTHLLTLLAAPDRCAAMGKQGQIFHEANFSWPTIASHMLRAMQTVS